MAVVFVLVGVILLCYVVKCNYKRFLLGISLPGPWAFPLLGNAQMVGKLKPEFIFLLFTELREYFGASFRMWLGPQLWVFLHTAEETHDALHDATLLKADTFNQLDILIGNGLLISHGQYWATHRRILTPAFHPQLLRSFAPLLARHADQLLLKLEQTKGQTVEVSDYLFPCILDAIVETSMGKHLHTQDADGHSIYTEAFHTASELLFKRMINPMLKPNWIFQRTTLCRRLNKSLTVIHTLMESVIRERQTYLCQLAAEERITKAQVGSDNEAVIGVKQRHSLLDALLKAEALSFKEVHDEVNTFVFAGVDTTTAAMSFVCYALAKYPMMQSKLNDELRQLENIDNKLCFSMEELNQLEYLDMFIKECLRFYTIVPTTGRQTTCTTQIGGRKYCEGVTIWLNIYGLAHDAKYFPEPHKFRPERFAKHLPQPEPYTYLPFSGGPHVCIGRKYSLLIMKLLTVKIVERYRLVLGSKADEELTLQAQMVLKSLNGINVKFLLRNS